MTLKDRWRRFTDRVDEFESKWWKRLFNPFSYGGPLRFLVLSVCTLYFLWHTHDLYVWWDSLWGVVSYVNHGQQRWARIWAVIIGGSGIAASLFAMVTITMLRWRERKGGKGLWFARTSKAEEELALLAEQREKAKKDAVTLQAGQEPEKEDEIRQAEPSLPPLADWTEAPQEPVGIAPPPEARPAQRFGDSRLEMKDGRATLTVTRKAD